MVLQGQRCWSKRSSATTPSCDRLPRVQRRVVEGKVVVVALALHVVGTETEEMRGVCCSDAALFVLILHSQDSAAYVCQCS